MIAIEFDPAKDEANIAKHGVSLRLASLVLEADPVIIEDDRFEYGETRCRAFAPVAGRMFTCVFTMRGEVYRIISLRRANRREIDALS